MQNREAFLQSLMELTEIAHTNENQLTMDEIHDYFSDIELDKEKLELIYNYFETNHISIKGHVRNQELLEEDVSAQADVVQPLPDEQQVIDLYLEELEGMVILTDEQKIAQIALLQEGDEAAKSALIGHCLHEVVDYVKQYKDSGVTFGDLIQEGNMGLIEGIDTFSSIVDQDFDQHIEDYISKNIKDAIREQALTTKTARDIATKANRLNEIATQLADDLGREASLEELTQAMQLEEDEIKDIMKISLDAINNKNAQ